MSTNPNVEGFGNGKHFLLVAIYKRWCITANLYFLPTNLQLKPQMTHSQIRESSTITPKFVFFAANNETISSPLYQPETLSEFGFNNVGKTIRYKIYYLQSPTYSERNIFIIRINPIVFFIFCQPCDNPSFKSVLITWLRRLLTDISTSEIIWRFMFINLMLMFVIKCWKLFLFLALMNTINLLRNLSVFPKISSICNESKFWQTLFRIKNTNYFKILFTAF